MTCSNCNRKLIIGLGAIVISIILSVNTNEIYKYILNSQLIINPKHPYAFNLWKDTPFPIKMDIYFFNWTNPEDINNPDIKPRLQEVGPYIFIENKTKVDIVWHNNGTISFKQLRYWYFDPEESVGTLDDLITSLDAIAVSAAATAKHFNYLIQKTLSFSLRGLVDNVHTTKKVRELLFEGYDDPLINIAKTLPKIPDIDVPPFDKFGWFVTRNGSKDYEGKYTMGTGENASIKFGQMYEWNDVRRSRFYTGECSNVSGSAGEFFPQHLPQTEVHLFFSDLCRPISLQYDGDALMKDIKAYRYIGGEKTFENGTKYPENRCYCEGGCIPSGMTSVQKCRFGAPGYISFPHFYLADPVYLSPFEGLEPNKDKHQFYILMEPRTGIPLYVDGKFQVNILIEPNPNIALYKNVPKLYFPILWFRQRVQISDEVATPFKILIAIPVINNCVAVIFGLIGIILISSTIFATKTKKQINCELDLELEDAQKPLKHLEEK